ncbi:uncharacterized protein LOC135144197 [Zophobas morio]|uniref:uncharacterized protein LOC135144197 n=1 Tax=Zophobas morio TaxID=2755281 RepID=UPI0030834E64
MKFIEERIMDNVFFETEENVDFYLETVHRYILKMWAQLYSVSSSQLLVPLFSLMTSVYKLSPKLCEYAWNCTQGEIDLRVLLKQSPSSFPLFTSEVKLLCALASSPMVAEEIFDWLLHYSFNEHLHWEVFYDLLTFCASNPTGEDGSQQVVVVLKLLRALCRSSKSLLLRNFSLFKPLVGTLIRLFHNSEYLYVRASIMKIFSSFCLADSAGYQISIGLYEKYGVKNCQRSIVDIIELHFREETSLNQTSAFFGLMSAVLKAFKTFRLNNSDIFYSSSLSQCVQLSVKILTDRQFFSKKKLIRSCLHFCCSLLKNSSRLALQKGIRQPCVKKLVCSLLQPESFRNGILCNIFSILLGSDFLREEFDSIFDVASRKKFWDSLLTAYYALDLLTLLLCEFYIFIYYYYRYYLLLL